MAKVPSVSFRGYCCSNLLTSKDSPIDAISDLQNPIHPIFSPNKFPKDFNYDAMTTKLRLATRLLECDATAMFATTMVDGDVYPRFRRQAPQKYTWTDVDHVHSSKPLHVDIFPNDQYKEPNDTTRERVKDILNNLSHKCRFEVPKAGMPEFNGGFNIDPSGPLPSPRSQQNFPRSSRNYLIKINTARYESVRQARKTPRSKQFLLSQQAQLAITIVHEIGHMIATVGSNCLDPKYEVYYKDHAIAEHGYDIENAIFGGQLSLNRHAIPVPMKECALATHVELAEHSKTVILSEWPSAHMLNICRFIKAPIATIWTPKEVPHGHITWRVPFPFIEKLFSEHFWVTGVDNCVVDALKAPKVGGWCFASRCQKGEYPTWDEKVHLDNDVLTAQHCEMIAATTGVCAQPATSAGKSTQ